MYEILLLTYFLIISILLVKVRNKPMNSTTITIKGQMVIPSKLRKKYGITTGTKILFYEETDGLKLVPVTKDIIKNNFGLFKTKGKLLKLLREEKGREKEL